MRGLRLLLRPTVVLRILALIVLLFVLSIAAYRIFGQPGTEQSLFLVVTDATALDSPQVTLWIDAAAETGVPLRVMPASELLRPKPWPVMPAGIVLPDGLLVHANRALTDRLRQYVQRGGKLMVVYDAATRFRSGEADIQRARLSPQVGLNYALFDRLGNAAIRRAPVQGAPDFLRSIHVPPGKYVVSPDDGRATLTTYQYGAVAYPSFATRGAYAGKVLLSGRDGTLVAGLRDSGRGQVLFVNLPLGYLKLRSDGMLLHGFLAWFGETLCGLPRLLAVPDGVGGLVLNWHIDSNASLAPLKELQAQTALFSHGPFSVHFTAGPDTYRLGDHSGLDLVHNPRSQAWVRLFASRGDAIGSHGGWIHNLFAASINDHNGATYGPWVARNNAALERITGRPVTEFSAPVGHQPQWLTDWLDRHGILGYYFTGDTGMAPTRSYRDGKRSDHHTWAFPLVPFGSLASFEDAAEAHVPESEMSRWLVELVDFVSDDHGVRLFYFHPPGGAAYVRSLNTMLKAVDARGDRFRWYTITSLARFLNRRVNTRWALDDESDGWRLSARNPAGLAGLAWHVPASSYTAVSPEEGQTRIEQVADGWIVHVDSGSSASVHLRAREPR